ncbi:MULTISPECIES: hypothetical protein [unclassified Streptomyces]|uniref:hypothetical protein n=1 Tax=unclassified Streptomyces TaxID=2593676 RepID=UPI00342A0CA9
MKPAAHAAGFANPAHERQIHLEGVKADTDAFSHHDQARQQAAAAEQQLRHAREELCRADQEQQEAEKRRWAAATAYLPGRGRSACIRAGS